MDLTNLEIDVVEMSKRVKESLNYAFSFYFHFMCFITYCQGLF